MIELVITKNLTHKAIDLLGTADLVAFRRLRSAELQLAREAGLKKFFLPELSASEKGQFFKEFDAFWDRLSMDFGAAHPFWRNAISSKMQEWENSGAHLLLTLFMLAHVPSLQSRKFIVVASSVEEEEAITEFARKHGWKLRGRLGSHITSVITQEFHNLLRFGFLCVKSISWKMHSPACTAGQERAPTTLVVSLFDEASIQTPAYKDPFFAQLHLDMAKAGERVCFFVDYLFAPTKRTAALIKQDRDVLLHTPYALVGWLRTIMILLQAYFPSFKIAPCSFGGVDFAGVFNWNRRRMAYPYTVNAAICYEAVRNLCRQYDFKRLIILYEGNVFERACIQAFRESCPGVRIDGYSHGVLYECNLKLRQTAAEQKHRPNPDFFIGTGPYYSNLFAKISGIPSQKINPGCSLREIPKVEAAPMPRSGKSFLIALDGIRSTADVLDWCLGNAPILDGYELIVRLHPNVPKDEMLKYSMYNKQMNVVFSERTLKEDLQRSFCVLYRHTSIGIQAWLNGVPAIHLNVNTPFAGDPLEDFNAGRLVANTSEKLKECIHMLQNLKDNELQELVAEARQFIANYFVTPNTQTLEVFSGKN